MFCLSYHFQTLSEGGPAQSESGSAAAANRARHSPSERQHATLRTLQPHPTSEWLTLLTLVMSDVVGIVLLFAGTQGATEAWLPREAVEAYPVSVVLAPSLLLALWVSGFYRLEFTHPALEMQRLATVTGITTGTAVLTVLAATGNEWGALLVAGTGLAGTAVLPVLRGLTRIVCARWPWWGRPAVVVGAPDSTGDVLNTLRRWPEIGLRPVAVLTERGASAVSESPPRDLGWASYLSRRFGTSYALVSLPDLSHERRAKLLMQYTRVFDHVFFTRDPSGAPALWSTSASGEGLMGYGVRSGAVSQRGTWALKRVLDVAGAGLLLLLLAPLFALIALCIRLDSSGPVLYRQERMGLRGRHFTVFKFRSMHPDAETRLHDVLARDPERRREYQTYHKLDDDPRVTPVGAFLRRYSLDELPQLLNVVRGEMSLVGPRPYMPTESPDMNGLQDVVLDTPPGITGLWQVSGRNCLSFEARVDLDVHYVQNWSLWLDAYLLLRTGPTLLAGEGRPSETGTAAPPPADPAPSTSPSAPTAAPTDTAPNAPPASPPLLRTEASVGDQALWLGKAALYESCICLSGWQWSGPYERCISLEAITQVETQAHTRPPLLELRTRTDTISLRLETGVMLWHWKLKALGVEVTGRG